MSTYVVAYDIAHSGRRRRVAKILLRYGRRAQWSVFEVELEPEELGEFKRRIGPLLAKSDAFDIYPIDRRDPSRRIRWQRPPEPEPVIVIRATRQSDILVLA